MKDLSKTDLKSIIAAQSGRFFWVGILLAVVGAACLFFPVVATWALNDLLGVVLVIAGTVQLYHSLSFRGSTPFTGALLSGLISFLAGLTLLFIPFSGALSMTMLLVIIMAVAGVYELSIGLNLRPARGWGWMVASGVISILLAFMIVTGLPSSAWILPGIVIGLHFLTTGSAMALLAKAIKSEMQH